MSTFVKDGTAYGEKLDFLVKRILIICYEWYTHRSIRQLTQDDFSIIDKSYSKEVFNTFYHNLLKSVCCDCRAMLDTGSGTLSVPRFIKYAKKQKFLDIQDEQAFDSILDILKKLSVPLMKYINNEVLHFNEDLLLNKKAFGLKYSDLDILVDNMLESVLSIHSKLEKSGMTLDCLKRQAKDKIEMMIIGLSTEVYYRDLEHKAISFRKPDFTKGPVLAWQITLSDLKDQRINP